MLSILVASALALATEPPSYRIQVETDVPARMRDETVLRADVLRPDAPGRFPAILYRTPYGKNDAWRESDVLLKLARAGYVVVVQDVRGRYRSDGDFNPYRQEGVDGYDSVEWVASLPYCDGSVGMAGLSYPGAVQWLAAVTAPPHLKAMAPAMTFASGREFFYFGGAFDLSWIGWAYMNITPEARRRLDLFGAWRGAPPPRPMGSGLSGPRSDSEARQAWRENKEAWLRHLPLRELPALKGVAPFYFEWLEHPEDGPYWDFANLASRYERVTVPALNLSGWHDEGYGPLGATRNFNGTRARGSRLILGPWTHGAPRVSSLGEGELDFGPNAGLDYPALLIRWFDRWLKGADNGIDRESPVRIFVMGENVWREENEWPLARTVYTPYYLSEGGRLLSSPPGEGNRPDRYTYDPRDPLVDPHEGELGPFDQSKLESRRDVLVYSTEPLARDLEVTGPIEVELWASSSALDTDFFVRLLDVHPDGRAFNLMSPTVEVLRARYRSGETHAELLTPGKAERLRLKNLITSNVFKTGHRLRIHVTSSFFPHVDRNLNTGGAIGAESASRTAEQTIYHDREHASRIILPVIPR